MIGVLIILIVSWILLFLIERENILSLGFFPISKRLKQFLLGFVLMALLCAGVQLFEMVLRSSNWHFNEDLTTNLILGRFWWDFRSVVTEELIFRGALLYILIKRLGSTKAILISSVMFGIYHWFSFGIFGNIIPMSIVFIGTGLMGFAWALAFWKTNSIFMPVGLHLGWNFTFNSVFSKGPLGEAIIITEGGNQISDWFSLIGLWLVPIILLLIIKYWIPKEETMARKEMPAWPRF